MKKVLILSLLLANCYLFAQDYWLHKPSPTTKWLTRITFVDTLYGWASGDSGAIIHTSNGGLNWTVQNSGIVSFFIDDIFFLDRDLGWGIANDYYFNGTKLLRTTNGGQNWQLSIFPDSTQVFNTIYFLDSQTGYLSGYSGSMYKSTNGGLNWLQQRVDTNYCPILYMFPKKCIYFQNSQTGFASGGHIDIQGMIWKTSDFGQTWYSYCITPEPIEKIKSVSPTRVFATGGDYEFGLNIVNSYDGGNTWLYDTSAHIWGIGKAIAFRTPSELWIPTSIGQTWALSLDSGGHRKSWQIIPCPDSTSVYDALFVTPRFGWACGTNGALLQYNTAIIGIPGYGTNVASGFDLYQNYPNPFNPSTVIRYQLPIAALVYITVYDVSGKLVSKFFEGMKTTGAHKFIFSARNLSSGVYFYRINAGEFVDSKKMVILK